MKHIKLKRFISVICALALLATAVLEPSWFGKVSSSAAEVNAADTTVPTGLTEIGWTDFTGLSIKTYETPTPDDSKGTYTGDSLDGTLFNDDIIMGEGSRIRYGGNNWYGLDIKIGTDTTGEYVKLKNELGGSVSAGSEYIKTYYATDLNLNALVGQQLNLKISTQISGSSYTFGVWINDIMLGDYITITPGEGNAGKGMALYGTSSNITLLHMPPIGFEEINWTDFGLQYTEYPDKSGDLAVAGTYTGDSLDRTLLDDDIIVGDGSIIRYGGTGWPGLYIRIRNDAAGDGVVELSNQLGGSVSAGSEHVTWYYASNFGEETLVNKQFNLKISTEISDDGAYTFGIWINDTMVGGFITIIPGENQAGKMVGLQGSGSSITLVKTEHEPPTDFTEISWTDFEGLENTTYTSTASGEYKGKATLHRTLLNANITMGENSYIRYGGTGWPGLHLKISKEANTNRGVITLSNQLGGTVSSGSEYLTWNYTSVVGKDTLVDQEFNLKISTEISGEHYRFGVWIDDVMLGGYITISSIQDAGNFALLSPAGIGITLADAEEDSTPEEIVYDEITIEKLASASGVNGGTWAIYPTPQDVANTPGTPWETSFADVVYEVDGVRYTTSMTRANDHEGLYIKIDGTILDPSADGVTVTIKAGQYRASDSSHGIHIVEDFTFYVIKGALTTEFNFDDPAFTSDVYCNLDVESYIITDADTVTIDGETYSMGDAYTKVGVHTLTYNMYDREYTRKVVCYRYGDATGDDKVNACDLVRYKKYLSSLENDVLDEAGIMSADMNTDGNLSNGDIQLLREYLIFDEGILVLSPILGAEVALPSDAVTTLMTDYEEGKSESIKTGDDLYQQDAITLNWVARAEADTYQIYLSTSKDMTDAFIYETTAQSYDILNLIPKTTYYWKLVAGTYETEVRTFHTADTVRTLTIDGVSNTRDSGGYKALEGKTVKYGMIYRGGKLNDITEEGIYQMLEVLGMKTDLDLRQAGEGGAGESSPLGSTVKYYNYSAPYYWHNMMLESYKEALINEIKVFAQEENYPIYVHCSIGRDRTGTILFLINGLLGVSKEDLALDYELSFLSAVGGSDSASVSEMMGYFDEMYEGIQAYVPGGTFAEACEAFMEEYCGISQEEIDSIRNILLQ